MVGSSQLPEERIGDMHGKSSVGVQFSMWCGVCGVWYVVVCDMYNVNCVWCV